MAFNHVELEKNGLKLETLFTRDTKDACLKNIISCTKRKLFILKWIFTYSNQDFIGDLLAGITIGLTVIPQSMALASIAGVPAQVYKRRYYRNVVLKTESVETFFFFKFSQPENRT